MKVFKNRALAVLVALCMMFSLLPVTAMADGDEDTAGAVESPEIADTTEDAEAPEDTEVLDLGEDEESSVKYLDISLDGYKIVWSGYEPQGSLAYGVVDSGNDLKADLNDLIVGTSGHTLRGIGNISNPRPVWWATDFDLCNSNIAPTITDDDLNNIKTDAMWLVLVDLGGTSTDNKWDRNILAIGCLTLASDDGTGGGNGGQTGGAAGGGGGAAADTVAKPVFGKVQAAVDSKSVIIEVTNYEDYEAEDLWAVRITGDAAYNPENHDENSLIYGAAYSQVEHIITIVFEEELTEPLNLKIAILRNYGSSGVLSEATAITVGPCGTNNGDDVTGGDRVPGGAEDLKLDFGAIKVNGKVEAFTEGDYIWGSGTFQSPYRQNDDNCVYIGVNDTAYTITVDFDGKLVDVYYVLDPYSEDAVPVWMDPGKPSEKIPLDDEGWGEFMIVVMTEGQESVGPAPHDGEDDEAPAQPGPRLFYWLGVETSDVPAITSLEVNGKEYSVPKLSKNNSQKNPNEVSATIPNDAEAIDLEFWTDIGITTYCSTSGFGASDAEKISGGGWTRAKGIEAAKKDTVIYIWMTDADIATDGEPVTSYYKLTVTRASKSTPAPEFERSYLMVEPRDGMYIADFRLTNYKDYADDVEYKIKLVSGKTSFKPVLNTEKREGNWAVDGPEREDSWFVYLWIHLTEDEFSDGVLTFDVTATMNGKTSEATRISIVPKAVNGVSLVGVPDYYSPSADEVDAASLGLDPEEDGDLIWDLYVASRHNLLTNSGGLFQAVADFLKDKDYTGYEDLYAFPDLKSSVQKVDEKKHSVTVDIYPVVVVRGVPVTAHSGEEDDIDVEKLSVDEPVEISIGVPDFIAEAGDRVAIEHRNDAERVRAIKGSEGYYYVDEITVDNFSNFTLTLTDKAVTGPESESGSGNAANNGGGGGGGGGAARPSTNPSASGSTTTPSTPTTPTTPTTPSTVGGFSDVPTGNTFATQIAWAQANGYMGGYSDGTFRPNANTTRQALWMVLGRIAGAAPADMAAAREWAVSAGISDGTGAEGNMSRQQMITMLYRFAQSQGKTITGSADLSGYSDNGVVASYAQEAIAWGVANGIITGTTDGKLNPEGVASRAHFAAFLYRYCNLA